jgi:hypothetical protein
MSEEKSARSPFNKIVWRQSYFGLAILRKLDWEKKSLAEVARSYDEPYFTLWGITRGEILSSGDRALKKYSAMFDLDFQSMKRLLEQDKAETKQRTNPPSPFA